MCAHHRPNSEAWYHSISINSSKLMPTIIHTAEGHLFESPHGRFSLATSSAEATSVRSLREQNKMLDHKPTSEGVTVPSNAQYLV